MNRWQFLVLLFLLSSCRAGQTGWLMRLKNYAETGDRELAVQVTKLPLEAQDSLTLNLKVRVKINAPLDSRFNEQMLYRTDSCFHLQGERKSYDPELVQAVAAGVKGSFEYLVCFNTTVLQSEKSLALIYKDKYFNKKTYTLILK